MRVVLPVGVLGLLLLSAGIGSMTVHTVPTRASFPPAQFPMPSAVQKSAPAGSVVITSVVPIYTTLPYTLRYSITVANVTARAQNVSMSVAVTYTVDGAIIANNSIPFNASTPLQYSVVIDQTFLTGWCTPNCYANGLLVEGPYLFSVWLSVKNSTNPGLPTSITSASASTELAAHPPTGRFLTPQPNAAVAYGTVTISGEYNGSFVNSANITVASAGKAIFFQGVLSPQAIPNQQEGFAVVWSATTGAYLLTLTLGTPYGARSVSENFTVKAPTPPTYYNTTGFQLGSLGPAATGALLIVVGLIVGEITGLVVARLRPGARTRLAPKPVAVPPANECSMCHEVFGSPEALKEHTQSQHGLTV